MRRLIRTKMLAGLALGAVVAASAAACASAPSGAVAPSLFAPVTDLAALRAVYDSGFARVVRAVPSMTLSDPTPLRQLRELCLFRTEQVHWAKVQGDAYVSAEPGVRFDGASGAIRLGRDLVLFQTGTSRTGWLAIVPPGHRILRGMPGFMGVDMGITHALLIRPAAVTSVWAGLLLVHHLSHLQEAVLGTVRPDLTKAQMEQVEVRVLWRTLTAADLLAESRLRPALDLVIGRLHPDSLAALAEQIDSLDFTDFRFIDRMLPADGPVSEAEVQDRAAFFTVSLLIRYAETHPGPLPPLLAALDHLYAARQRN